jgi:putative transposase
LIVDGAWYRFRQLQGPKRVVLAVLGVKADRRVVLLGFHVARSESSPEIARVLHDLKSRGLSGQQLELIVADGSGGIEAAAAEVYPWARLQRCCWHQLQLLRTHASGQKIARVLMREAARCYRSADARQVQRHLQAFLARWRTRQPHAIRAFATDLDKTLNYLSLPPELHRCLRTTNLLERLIREMRQRTKLIGSFDQPVHLEQLLLGTIIQSTWIQLPVTLQPLLTTDTII